MRSNDEIEEQIGEATDSDGKFSGMTYEEGVKNALEWVLEETEDKPMDD